MDVLAHRHVGEHFREGCPACIAEDNDLVPGALAQRFKDERNIARQQLTGAVGALEHIAVHGDHDQECRRPPQDCARDALDRLGRQ
jgi:hypothetical protein